MSYNSDFFLLEGALRPRNASVALIVVDDAKYLMQLRDQKRGIFYPGYWGLFGGAIESGETPEDALRRELFEELGYKFEALSYFTRFSFDFSSCGFGPVDRHVYEVKITTSDMNIMTLEEGAALRAFPGRDLLLNTRVTPYDAFAIWMHVTKEIHLQKSV